MCEPVTIGTMTLGLGEMLAIGGTAISAMGAIQQGNAAAQMGKVQAQIARDQAEDAVQRGQVEEDRARRNVARMMGTQRATLGSQLVEMDSGSASDLLADTAQLGELDALTIRNNAQREAYGYESKARVARYEGDQAKKASYFNAAGSLLGGVGGTLVSSRWYGANSSLNKVTIGGG